jgi:uncharacterized protein YceK
MMRRFIGAALAMVVLSGSGCMTIKDIAVDHDGQRIYGGVRRDCEMIADPDSMAVLPFVVFGILDFPLSLALDTGLLPVTLLFALFRGISPE